MGLKIMPKHIPTVTDKDPNGSKSYHDLYSRLLNDRIIVLDTDVDEVSSSIIVGCLLFLQLEDADKPIHFYINSPGGSCVDGLQIYDTMKTISCPVYTYVVGQAASMGSFLASSGDKRFISKHSKHMMHMVSSGVKGQILDMEVAMHQTRDINETLMNIYSENTGKPTAQIKEDLNRDFYLTAQESIDYGLADEIIPYAVKKLV
jgi:ATP-dependent Clp protease, protease subunit